MKRFLLMAVAATAMLTACEKTEMVPNGDAQEISFVAVNQVATKAPVSGTTFIDGDNMDVVAFLAGGDGAVQAPFFNETLFTQNSGTKIWTGKRYWPLSDSFINFLSVTNTGGGVAGKVANAFTNTTTAQSVVSVLTNNQSADQTDLMFAAGYGEHEQGGAYTAVDMKFKHALSWINFTVKTGNGTTVNDPKITINSITLNDPYINGTLTVNNPKFNTTDKSSITNNLTTDWSSLSAADIKLIYTGIDAVGNAESSLVLNGTPTAFGGNGILVIPGNQTSITINYTITQPADDNTSTTYNYTQDLSGTWDMSKKYVYNISMTLTEIQITPSVLEWDTTSNGIGIY